MRTGTALSLIFLFAGCYPAREVRIDPHGITVAGLYDVSIPPGWQYIPKTSLIRSPLSATSIDYWVVNCSTPATVAMCRAVFVGAKDVDVSEIAGREKLATALVDDFFKTADRPTTTDFIVTARDRLSVPAVSIDFYTEEAFLACGVAPSAAPKTTVKNRLTILFRGDERAFSTWGRTAPKFTVLWLASRPDDFKTAEEDYESMLSSLRFSQR